MFRSTIIISILVCMIGCSNQPQTAPTERSAGPAMVIATNYPLFYFAERLVDANFDVRLPVPADGDPAFWQPDEAAISTMQNADLVLLNGATYEKWLPAVSLPASVMVDTSQAFAAEYLKLAIKHTHSHGAAGEHTHAGTAFTTWLDMTKAEAQAQAVADALVQLRPDARAAIETRLDGLVNDLRKLDTALQEATPASADVHVLASHPVYDYLAERYEMQLTSFMWEPETMPSAADWKDFSARTDASVQWMLYEDEPSPEIIAELEQRGVSVCVFRPCGNRPPSGDFLSEMNANIERLRAVYAP